MILMDTNVIVDALDKNQENHRGRRNKLKMRLPQKAAGSAW